MEISTLRPGLLVGLKSHVRGGVNYDKRIIEEEHITEGGAKKGKWETERTIEDPVENEAAGKARGEACRIIRSICSQTAFGLLCSEDNAAKLDEAIRDAQKVAEEFNMKAKLARVEISVITGRIAADDVRAVKAINEEVRGLMADMETAIKNCDPAAMRKAASEAKALGAMLSDDARERVRVAVDAARGAATRLNRLGEQAAAELNRKEILNIRQARTAFLDVESEEVKVARPKARGRAVDAAPDAAPPEVKKPRAARRQVEAQP